MIRGWINADTTVILVWTALLSVGVKLCVCAAVMFIEAMQRPRPQSAHTHRHFHTLLKEARFPLSVHSIARGEIILLYVLSFSLSHTHTDAIGGADRQNGQVMSYRLYGVGGWWWRPQPSVWLWLVCVAKAHSHEGHSILTSISTLLPLSFII